MNYMIALNTSNIRRISLSFVLASFALTACCCLGFNQTNTTSKRQDQMKPTEERIGLQHMNGERSLKEAYYHGFEADAITPIPVVAKNDDDLWVVIHIGPMKTGSSSIQKSLGPIMKHMTEEDKFEDAGFSMHRGIEAFHMIGCFRPDAVRYTGTPGKFELSCHPDALNQVSKVAERGHHLMITAEYLTDPKTDIAKLKGFLKPWKNHKVVAYYRRYYDWLVSFHNQIYKQRTPATRKSIAAFLEAEAENEYFWKTMYLVDAVDRWGKYFSFIEIINIYDIPNNDVRQAFYCQGLVEAKASCNKYLEYKTKEPESFENPSVPLVYSDLAYHAKHQGLWNESITGLTESQVAKLVAYNQERTLNRTQWDFGKAVVCPERWVMNHLLKKSLEVEKELFPTYFFYHGERDIITHFNTIKSTKMCHIDAEYVLEYLDEWKTFFRKLNSYNVHSHL
jgi:hypothetical protein